MKTKFFGKKISGILALLPQTEYKFEDDMKFNSLSQKQNLKLKNTMGYGRHRFFKDETYLSQVAVYGLNRLFEKGLLKKEEISALVVATTTPDFLMPATANLIAGELNLSPEIFCMDTNQQCAGFINGLFQAFMPDTSDTSSYPLAGDAICITVVENGENDAFFHCVTDAKDYDALVFPAMGFRKPTNEEKAKFSSSKYGGRDCLQRIHMDGQAVFQYVMQNVPKYIVQSLAYAGADKDELDYYFFHQPNKFMVDKLAQKLGVSSQKAPSNVVTFYGNSNSSTIPVCIAHNAKEQMTGGDIYKCMLAGFGAGLNYASIVTSLGKFDFCDTIITDF